MKHPIIGILGGMGPYASLRCYRLFLEEARLFIDGRGNHDFPHLLIDNIPVRDLTDDLASLNSTIEQVRCEYLRLRNAGAQIMLMACNTMHLYVDDIYDVDGNITHISLIENMGQYLSDNKHNSVGILGSINTIRNELYHKELKDRGIVPLSLEDETILNGINNIIGKVIGGEKLEADDICMMQSAVNILIEKGAECIILGCTELPIAFENFDSSIPLYDPLILAIRHIYSISYIKD